MKNLKKIIAFGLATTVAVLAMSMTALADYDDMTSYASLPTLSEVDTSKASTETPVTYIDEKTGAIVTIYDPSITVECPSVSPNVGSVVAEGYIYVPYASNKRFGSAPDSFEALYDGQVSFTLLTFHYDKYNFSLNKEGVTGSPLAVVKNYPIATPATLTGLKEGVRYEFRVSSYIGDGNSTYIATM